jgi:DNA-binding response OmpR family regulator
VGADDYVAKPFNPREVSSRARVILRRTLQVPHGVASTIGLSYTFGAWQLSTVERALRHTDGSRVGLTDAEFRLLLALLAEAPRTLSRSQLIERLHEREFDPADRRIDVGIGRVRHLLRDKARSPLLIKTLHGKGYMIGVSVARRREGNPSTLLRAASSANP